jgi:exodeoxyribonuclease V beta subunit
VRRPGYSYERDFGGVFYLFLRGLEAAEAATEFSRSTGARLIEELDALFSGGLATDGHR